MKNGEFERLLRQSLGSAAKEEAGLEETVLRAKIQASRSPNRERIPFRHFLLRQVRYIGWKLWGTQGLLLLLFDRMLTQLYGGIFWDSATGAARLLFCLSTLVAMMALPLLYRSRKYRMQEIEGAAYFSSAKLLLAKLAVIGLGDGLLLGGMFLTALVRTSMGAGSLGLYLLLPFFTVTAAYLYMLGHCSGRGFYAGSIALGAGMLLLAAGLPGRWGLLFQQELTFGTAVFGGVLLLFSAEQIRYLSYRSPYSELQVI